MNLLEAIAKLGPEGGIIEGQGCGKITIKKNEIIVHTPDPLRAICSFSNDWRVMPEPVEQCFVCHDCDFHCKLNLVSAERLDPTKCFYRDWVSVHWEQVSRPVKHENDFTRSVDNTFASNGQIWKKS